MKLTQVDGCPDRSSVVPGMAFFVNTGPFGTFCDECVFAERTKVGRIRCRKFRKLTGQEGKLLPKTPPRSCKYFERAPK